MWTMEIISATVTRLLRVAWLSGSAATFPYGYAKVPATTKHPIHPLERNIDHSIHGGNANDEIREWSEVQFQGKLERSWAALLKQRRQSAQSLVQHPG